VELPVSQTQGADDVAGILPAILPSTPQLIHLIDATCVSHQLPIVQEELTMVKVVGVAQGDPMADCLSRILRETIEYRWRLNLQ